MAATKKKRSSVPSTKSHNTHAKRQSRRKAPTSQYTDVGQRKPSAKPKPVIRPSQVVAATSTTVDEDATSKAVAAAKQLISLEPTNVPKPSSTLPTSTEAPVTPVRQPRRYQLILLSAAAVLVLLMGLAVWRRHHQPESVATLVSQVSRVTVLPTHETPIVSTVVDKQRVTQAFLANAQNGDKVLLYYQAKKAVVYRPSTHQVITIGPIAQGAARVFVRNGGVSNPAIERVRTAIDSDLVDFTMSSQDSSPNPHYPATEVVDLTGVRPDVADKLASLLHAKVTSLPADEHRPDGDMLVIVGRDAQ